MNDNDVEDYKMTIEGFADEINYLVYNSKKGFVESCGWNGTTFTYDLGKAFQFTDKEFADEVAEDENGEVLMFAE